MAIIETGGSLPAGASAVTPGAAQDVPGVCGPRRPLDASGEAARSGNTGDDVHKSPDPMAVTDRYHLATPYTSSTLNL